MKCERCGQNEATVHWTEAVGGVLLEKHFCADCQAEEFPGLVPVQNELRFQCRCGEVVVWRFPCGSCGHGADQYARKGRAEIEISTCKCGVRFVAVARRWKCKQCGAESVVPPRQTGARGYLYDHIYGPPEGVNISIRGILP